MGRYNSHGKPDDCDDVELVQKARRELPYNTNAFEQIVRRYEPYVLRFCTHMIGDPDEAQDASQEVFLRVHRSISQFRGESSFRSWLSTITRNVCLTALENKKRQGARARKFFDESQTGGIRKESPQPDSPDWIFGIDGPLGEALAELDGPERELLLMRFVHELGIDEIAKQLDLNLSAAKMRLYRSIGKFRAAFERRKIEEM